MKRKFMQIAALCLCAVLLTAPGEGQSAYAVSSGTSSGKIIRVGLHHDGPYGTGSVEGLNLANETGAGFRLGYYDDSNRFVLLGSTSEEAVSVVKTTNVYYGTYNGYTSYHSALTASAVAVGDYHLQLPGTYSTYAQVQAAASRYEGGFPAYIDRQFYVRIGNYTTQDKAVTAQAALRSQGVETEIKGTSAYGVSVVVTGTNTILFQFDDLGKDTGLGVEPNAAGGGAYTTWSKSVLYPGGFRFERINGGNMTVVNMVEFEDYVEGVVATEMSDSWPVEALKAQAVAARSYAATLGSKHSAHHFDICNGTDCQAYTGKSRTGSNTRAAVEQTAGQVCIYNGKVAQTSYYSSNGGASESSSVVWGSNQTAYPYLIGKVDPYEATSGVNNNYTKTISSDELVAALKKKGYNTVGNSIVSIAVVSLTDSGNPKQVTFTDNNGKKFTLDSMYVVRDIVGLRSYRYGVESTGLSAPGVSVNGSAPVNANGLYAIDGNGNVVPISGDAYVLTGSGTVQLEQGGTGDGSAGGGIGSLGSTTGNNGLFIFVGKGWGHNVGMSQWGAYAMAKQGYTYLDILQFYYTDITVRLM
ncbi:MAG: SpoIID/LytB domain-containing protein [Acutalibacter sp.]|nr:SpoIID/LytB domain-containing protein [Acutalibacter sp.]